MQITDKNFEEEVEKFHGVVLVDFYASWCGPCKLMMPTIEELVGEYESNKGIKIGKINIDENLEVASKFNVVSIPTLIIFKAGVKIKELIGLQSKESLVEAINEVAK